MGYIILSILSATGIFWVFKMVDKKNLPTAAVITINYLVAYLSGMLISPQNPLSVLGQEWSLIALLIGFLFIIFFFIIGLCSKYAGMSITSVASKMSVVVPISFSIFYYHEAVGVLKMLAMVLALVALFLTVYNPDKNHSKQSSYKKIGLPILLFLGMGLIDSLIKYAQGSLGVTQSINAFFTATLFLVAFLLGLSYLLGSKNRRQSLRKTSVYMYGIVLGLFNYGSIYFLISALNSGLFDTSVIFGINNVSIVALSVLLGVWVFKERISKLNYIGVVGSLVAIAVLSVS